MVDIEEVKELLITEPVTEEMKTKRLAVKKYLEDTVFQCAKVVAIKEFPAWTSYLVEYEKRMEDTVVAMRDKSERLKKATSQLIVHFNITEGFPLIKIRGNQIKVDIPKPKAERGTLRFRDVLHDAPKKKEEGMKLPVTFGMGETGKIVTRDLTDTDARSLLIAGQNGSGKTVFGRNIVLSLLLFNNSSDVRIKLFDPKGTEFPMFKGIAGVDKIENEKALMYRAADELYDEMLRRNDLFRETECMNFNEYNIKHPEDKLPYYFIIIDEYQNILPANNGQEFGKIMTLLAREGRSAGMNIIAMTQKPLSQEMKGIKAELNGRVCFKVDAPGTAKTVFGEAGSGAEKLLGKGDGIFLEEGAYTRFQAPFIDEERGELSALCNYLREHRD